MKKYSVKDMKKLVNIIKKKNSGLTTEEKVLIAYMIEEELTHIHCDNYYTMCPSSHLLQVGQGSWTIKCEFSGEIINYDCKKIVPNAKVLSNCPYNIFRGEISEFIAGNQVLELKK